MMKIFFVGMHNKPEMSPLDSRTKTGKVIDAIIEQIPAECVKTNLCDIDYFPTDEKLIRNCNLEWDKKHNPTNESIIVLLGAWVHGNFLLTNSNIIKIAHPASIFGSNNKEAYIAESVAIILTKLNNPCDE